LNADKVIDKITQLKNTRSLQRVLRVESSEIWTQDTVIEDSENLRIELAGHSSIQLPDLNSILIAGGRYHNNKNEENYKFLIYSLVDKSVRILEQFTSSAFKNQPIPSPRLNPIMNLINSRK
jgi:hypothetical protein